MKIIGIFGGSGSGKTTICNILQNKINNSTIFSMDVFMHKYWDENKKRILDELNIIANENVFWYNYILDNIDNVKKAVNIIKPYLENEFQKFVNENKKYDVIIIDWVFLPLIPVFDTCDFTICVTCDLETKIKRLSDRLDINKKLEKWPKNSLLARINNSSLNEFGYKANYTILNTNTLKDLENNLNTILSKENINFNVVSEESNNITYWDTDR